MNNMGGLQEYDNEMGFQKWYAGHAKRLGLHPNPDHPRRLYDYRAAYTAGIKPGPDGQLPSTFRRGENAGVTTNNMGGMGSMG